MFAAMERLDMVPTFLLEKELALLQIRIIHDVATDLQVERFCLIQLELGARAVAERVIDQPE